MGASFNTGDTIETRVAYNATYGVEDTTFVKNGETLALGDDEISVLTPFILNSTPGQSVTLQSSDLTTHTVTFDETTGTVTIGGVTYSQGDRFILNGKSCRVAFLN